MAPAPGGGWRRRWPISRSSLAVRSSLAHALRVPHYPQNVTKVNPLYARGSRRCKCSIFSLRSLCVPSLRIHFDDVLDIWASPSSFALASKRGGSGRTEDSQDGSGLPASLVFSRARGIDPGKILLGPRNVFFIARLTLGNSDRTERRRIALLCFEFAAFCRWPVDSSTHKKRPEIGPLLLIL